MDTKQASQRKPRLFVLRPREDWIVDKMHYQFINTCTDRDLLDFTPVPSRADVIWLLADWCWDQVPIQILRQKTVVTTVHHTVPDRFDVEDFKRRDDVTDLYHVFNDITLNFVRQHTDKPVKLIKYWVDDETIERDISGYKKTKHDKLWIGSFQRDTLGSSIESGQFLPKLEKGPDLLCDYLETLDKRDIHVVLAGWRRQYVINRLKQMQISFTYHEMLPSYKLHQLYCDIDLYVVSSRHEGGPQALLECGITQTPVISRNCGIASQVLPSSAINDDLTQASPAVPDVSSMRLSLTNSLSDYVNMFKSLTSKKDNNVVTDI